MVHASAFHHFYPNHLASFCIILQIVVSRTSGTRLHSTQEYFFRAVKHLQRTRAAHHDVLSEL